MQTVISNWLPSLKDIQVRLHSGRLYMYVCNTFLQLQKFVTGVQATDDEDSMYVNSSTQEDRPTTRDKKKL